MSGASASPICRCTIPTGSQSSPLIWRPGAEVTSNTADFSLLDSPEFINSPLAIVFGEAREVRFRLDDPASKRFPFFGDFHRDTAQGVIVSE